MGINHMPGPEYIQMIFPQLFFSWLTGPCLPIMVYEVCAGVRGRESWRGNRAGVSVSPRTALGSLIWREPQPSLCAGRENCSGCMHALQPCAHAVPASCVPHIPWLPDNVSLARLHVCHVSWHPFALQQVFPCLPGCHTSMPIMLLMLMHALLVLVLPRCPTATQNSSRKRHAPATAAPTNTDGQEDRDAHRTSGLRRVWGRHVQPHEGGHNRRSVPSMGRD